MDSNKKVVPSIGNKIVDENGKIYNSIRQLAKEIHVGRQRIKADMNSKGYFSHKGHTYVLVDLGVANKISLPKNTEPTLFSEDELNGNETPIVIPKVIEVEKVREDEDEYQEYRKMK